jgi:hypothetical protein
LRLQASVHQCRISAWKIDTGSEEPVASSSQPEASVKLALLRNFEFKLPLALLLATPSAAPAERAPEPKATAVAVAATSKVRLRFSLWQNRLPVDSLPLEGWIELQVVSEGELLFGT